MLPATSTLPEGVTLGAYNSRNDRRNLFSQTDLVWESRLGGIDQTLLFGFEAGRQTSRNHRQSGTIIGLPGNSCLDVVLDGTGLVLWLNLTTTMISSTSTNTVMAVISQSRKL